MPPRSKQYQKISLSLKKQAAAGLKSVGIGKANRIKEELLSSPNYDTEFKPLIDHFENKIAFLQERDVEKEIRELQQLVQQKDEEIEKLKSTIQALQATPKLSYPRPPPKSKGHTSTINFGPTSSGDGTIGIDEQGNRDSKRCQISPAKQEYLVQVSDAASNLIPESKSDKLESTGFDVARAIAIRIYCKLRGEGMGKIRARNQAASMVWKRGCRHKAKKLMGKWVVDLERDFAFIENLRGQNQARASLLYHGDVFERVHEWCKEQRHVNSKHLRDWVNANLRPTLATAPIAIGTNGISKGTARRWLYRVGFVRQRKCKGAYTDGHDAPATLLARKEYVARFRSYEPLMERFVEREGGTIDVEEPDLDSTTAKAAADGLGWNEPFVIKNVWHDEATAKPADKGKFIWIMKGDSALMAKSEGQGYMVSGFMTSDGLLTVPGEKPVLDSAGKPIIDKNGEPVLRGEVENENGESVGTASIYWQTGANADGYFACDDLVAQIKSRMIPVFKSRYPPNRYRGLVHFDNATSHTAFAADALNTTKITKGDASTTTPIMRSTAWMDPDGNVRHQCLQRDDGKPKGAFRKWNDPDQRN